MSEEDFNQQELDLSQRYEVEIPLMPSPRVGWHLPAFSGYRTACAKCGYGESDDDQRVGVTYHQGVSTDLPCWALMTLNMDLHAHVGFPEHMDRKCMVCGHTWVEATANQPGGEEG